MNPFNTTFLFFQIRIITLYQIYNIIHYVYITYPLYLLRKILRYYPKPLPLIRGVTWLLNHNRHVCHTTACFTGISGLYLLLTGRVICGNRPDETLQVGITGQIRNLRVQTEREASFLITLQNRSKLYTNTSLPPSGLDKHCRWGMK